MEQCRMYIGGEFTESVSDRWMDVENPFNGEVWAKVAQGSAEAAGRAVQAVHPGSAARTTSTASRSTCTSRASG